MNFNIPSYLFYKMRSIIIIMLLVIQTKVNRFIFVVKRIVVVVGINTRFLIE